MSDFFADIARNGIGGKAELLCTNEPKQKSFVYLPLEKSDAKPIPTPKKMDSEDELNKELTLMRAKYAPFLNNFAPVKENITQSIYIDSFTVDGKEVTIPEYGGPVGYAKKVYTSSFVLDCIGSDKAHYICLDGADYKAVVYINDTCVGVHEGFFSPFEFCIDECIKKGENSLKIELYNDFIYMGNKHESLGTCEGDKLYAATGIGWDDPELGWHHCPPGMGIYAPVRVEIRNRTSISDIFVREDEIWVEVLSADYKEKDIKFNISVYGQNFEEKVCEDMAYVPTTTRTVGLGDSLTEAQVGDALGNGIPQKTEYGINVYKIPFKVQNPRLWSPNEPWLYRVFIDVYADGELCDTKSAHFGVRSFTQDKESTPKGMFYLNGNKIRLRGANTMGFEQLDVLRGDTNQLIDDILLAKICNMNFLRLTQRPVQKMVYDYCDMLGMMTQTDLPLFGCMRRNKFAEGVRQAEEMERIVRSHPCNIVVSYINEPFPNANNKPHRHLERAELMDFFTACDKAVLLHNPDRVIKHVDGDYDPPSETMPDNHCYPMWYNGHGIDIGLLNKGYWLPTKPDWYYGCGEFGAEGLDFADLMKRRYPKEWLSEPFNPNKIIGAQTGSFHHFFYDKGDDIESWVKKSQDYQAFATTMMTEAFRRDSKMVSNAIHLFIDAWPSGWMKTIMDCERKPKKAFFAYRDALEPVHISLRTDRFTYFEGEKISIDCYVCNDTNVSGEYTVVYEMEDLRAEQKVKVADCDVTYVSSPFFTVQSVNDRQRFTLKAILVDSDGKVVAHSSCTIEVFQKMPESKETDNEIIFDLKPGTYTIAGETVEVKSCSMLPLHFASRNTGHEAVEEFKEKDFSYWYNAKEDMITPIIHATFTADGFTPILLSGNLDKNDAWSEALSCAVKEYEGKKYIICNVDLRCENPVAQRFLNNLKTL